jgi:hypothetical protein
MLKLTHSKGRLNSGLAGGAILGAAIPVIATIATGGLAAVGLPLWIAFGGAISGLFAGNVELKSSTDRMLDRDEKQTARSDD